MGAFYGGAAAVVISLIVRDHKAAKHASEIIDRALSEGGTVLPNTDGSYWVILENEPSDF
jgi:thiazole synthase ThiGH ThiG subunit